MGTKGRAPRGGGDLALPCTDRGLAPSGMGGNRRLIQVRGLQDFSPTAQPTVTGRGASFLSSLCPLFITNTSEHN